MPRSSNDDRRRGLRTRAEQIINVAIIVAALACAGAWLHFWFRAPPVAVQRAGLPQYVVGDSLTDVPEIAGLGAEPTLVLYLDSACNICTESLGFYRKLIEHSRQHGSRVRIVAASRESLEAFRKYLADHRLDPHAAIAIDDGSPFKMTRTPTLILLNRMRHVTNIWIGRLATQPEGDVLAAIAAAGA